jgi:hypothetical protein
MRSTSQGNRQSSIVNGQSSIVSGYRLTCGYKDSASKKDLAL